MELTTKEPPINNQQIYSKLCEVEAILNQPKVEKGLWSIQDVADYCGLSYYHTFSHIVSDPNFPKSVALQSRTNGKSKRLFMKEDVIAFFKSKKS